MSGGSFRMRGKDFMSESREQKVIENAASQEITNPISNKIFRLIVMTAIGLGLISIILTAVMF